MKLKLVTFVCLAIAWNVLAQAKEVRNVLFLLADDYGLENTLYNSQSSCKTPNLERLAKRSVKFPKAFTAVSSCSPSRASILTGLPPHQTGVYGVLNTGYSKHYHAYSEIRSLPTILAKNGIRSGIIGKKHLAPDSVFHFDFSATMEDYGYLQAARNITFMKLQARKFLSENKAKPFFLYVGFGDPHRCDVDRNKNGLFCDKFGSGQADHGKIQDWTPTKYDPKTIKVPWYLPDTPQLRMDLAAHFTAVSRFDQGVGLMLKELESAGVLNSTLIIVTADNGPPFVNAKTTVYEPGINEPMLISNPFNTMHWGKESNQTISHLDMTPTILDWFGVKFPNYKMFNKQVHLSGQSVLKATENPQLTDSRSLYASHLHHEVHQYYPMRVVRSGIHKLIHNINYRSSYPIAGDIRASPGFQDLFNRTRHKQPTHWFRNLGSYFFRPEWELYDVKSDPREMNNLYAKMKDGQLVKQLKKRLRDWQELTMDPWIGLPQVINLEQFNESEGEDTLSELNEVEFD